MKSQGGTFAPFLSKYSFSSEAGELCASYTVCVLSITSLVKVFSLGTALDDIQNLIHALDAAVGLA